MIDLAILTVLLVASFGLAAWVLAMSARAVGSGRAGWRQGVLAAFLTSVFGGVFFGFSAWAKTLPRDQMLFMAVALLLTENVAAYMIYRRVFRLSAGRRLCRGQRWWGRGSWSLFWWLRWFGHLWLRHLSFQPAAWRR